MKQSLVLQIHSEMLIVASMLFIKIYLIDMMNQIHTYHNRVFDLCLELKPVTALAASFSPVPTKSGLKKSTAADIFSKGKEERRCSYVPIAIGMEVKALNLKELTIKL